MYISVQGDDSGQTFAKKADITRAWGGKQRVLRAKETHERLYGKVSNVLKVQKIKNFMFLIHFSYFSFIIHVRLGERTGPRPVTTSKGT